SQAIKAGARDSDKAADAIKEFAIRAIDGSDTTKEGFKGIGLSASRMSGMIAKGGKSAREGLDITLDRLRKVKHPAKRAEYAVALFGTQAEDLGDALYAMDVDKASKDFGKFGGSADKMGKTLRKGPVHELKVFAREMQQQLV